jgi:hypothetical protein
VPRRAGVPLIVLILVGLGLSGAALVALGAFFSWVSLGTAYPWELDPPPSQEAQFGIVRNAVTAGAALGLGITLLLSYRRQKTNEQSQDIAARALQVSASAQETAAEALLLANKQHNLDVERRHDDAIRELHSRYGRCAEQLAHAEVAVRLAGVYATAALADDWDYHQDQDQRQASLDLLCAYYRIPAKDVDRQDLDSPVREAIWSTIVSRLAFDCLESKRWSSLRLDFRQLQNAPSFLSNLLLQDTHLDFSRSNFSRELTIYKCQMRSGTLDLVGISSPAYTVKFSDFQLSGGKVVADFDNESPGKTLTFSSCKLDGGQIVIEVRAQQVQFVNCVFSGTQLDFSMAWSLQRVEFVDCDFHAEVGWQSRPDSSDDLKDVDLFVEGCSFKEGVPIFSSRPRLPQQG